MTLPSKERAGEDKRQKRGKDSDLSTVNVGPDPVLTDDRVPEDKLLRIRLDSVSGESFRHEPVELFNGEINVGRSSHWPISIPDDQMSRKHFCLRLANGLIEIEDQGSTNGTSVNGVRIGKAWIDIGDKITAGHTTMILRQAKSEPVYIDKECQYGKLYGRSHEMRRVFHKLAQWARAPRQTVLISGETGTGKELAAHAIHVHSQHDNSGSPAFIARSCADFSATVIEAELFGTETGGFTGARSRPGVFEQAIGGTLFLDEIGELPLPLQSKLLRVIESRKLVRLGGTKSIDVSNLRLIVASHRDLREMIDEGTFRNDLYYRLDVLAVHMPRLRDRGEDIRELSLRFLASINSTHGSKLSLSQGALQLLERHSWPGNVRELKNTITKTAYSARGDTIQASDLRFQSAGRAVSAGAAGQSDDVLATKLFGTTAEPAPWKLAKSAFQREYVRHLLELTDHDLTAAAKISEYTYDQFRKLVRKHGLRRARGRPS